MKIIPNPDTALDSESSIWTPTDPNYIRLRLNNGQGAVRRSEVPNSTL